MMSLHSAHHLHVELSAESAEAHHQKFMRDIEWRRNFFTDWMKNVFCFFTGALDRRKRDFFRVPPFMTSSERIKVVGMLVVVGSRNRQGHRAKAKIAKPSIAQPNTFSFQLNQRRRQMGCFSTPLSLRWTVFQPGLVTKFFRFEKKRKMCRARSTYLKLILINWITSDYDCYALQKHFPARTLRQGPPDVKLFFFLHNFSLFDFSLNFPSPLIAAQLYSTESKRFALKSTDLGLVPPSRLVSLSN